MSLLENETRTHCGTDQVNTRLSPSYGTWGTNWNRIRQGSPAYIYPTSTVQHGHGDSVLEETISVRLERPQPFPVSSEKENPHGFALCHCGLVLVEVVVFLYFIATYTTSPVIQFFLITQTYADHVNWTYSQVLDKVADYSVFLSICGNIPAIVAIIFIGSLADRFGRKVCMLIALFGSLMKMAVYITVIHLKLRLEYLYIGNALEGITGNYGTFLVGVYGIIADITEPGSQRNIRITTTEAATFVGGSAGLTAAGYWIHYLGHETAIIFAASMQGAAILFTLLFLPESLRRAHVIPVSLTSVRRSFEIFTSKEPRGRRSILLLTLAMFFISIYLLQANSATIILYLQGAEFLWSTTKITIYSGAYILGSWLSIVLIVGCLGKRIHDSNFLLIGTLSAAIGSLVQGLASNDEMIYGSAVLGALSNFLTPMSRTILSKSVPAKDQGALFSGVGIIEMAATTIAGVAAPALFKVGLHLYYGFHSLTFSGTAVVGFLIVVVLTFLMRRHESSLSKEIIVTEEESILGEGNDVYYDTMS